MQYKKNADGSDMLDNEGNPIPEENTNEETITPEEAKLLKESLANTVDELKELRKKNKELSEKKESKIETPIIEDEATKLAKAVKAVLNSEKMENAKTEKVKAFERFITENKEFHPDNDPTGLKRQALEEKLKDYNTEVMSVEKYYDVIGEAQLLLTGDNKSNTNRVNNPFSSSIQSRMTPKPVVVDKLTSKERKLVENGSATEEYILKLKEKRPAYLASLLERVRD